ncbi:methyltransferase family protein [Tianweitania sediminis]|uniref:Isoprenylcysteine carboxylmethyltransferase family protein n=1 Tax=Tianweitania sediminis TaxID=1502156 RepID=A0A8J7R0F6_9HYPH|nr:isoprenylcysteine carboxylmethyltransferase family protein [Tianweitania sediminis]MBP0437686.1 isoprenylcysteine carboxylmethyltransferase family protein [Tianweitania sediminis]
MKQNVRVFRQRKRIRFLWTLSPLLVALLLFTEPKWMHGDVRNEMIRQLGALALFTCIIGRCWASLHIGGQKNQQLITSGPYSRTRNPLYFFSSVGLAGVGLAVGSMTLGAVFFCFGYLAFSYVIRREEWALEQFFRGEYRAYVMLVPRFFPSLSENLEPTTTEQVLYKPQALHTTFRQALLFLLPIPLYNVLQYLHASGIIEPVMKLY